MMDLDRINQELKKSFDQMAQSFEIDTEVLRKHPEIIQQQRAEAVEKLVLNKPDSVKIQDIYIPSSTDGHKIRLHIYQNENVNQDNVILYFHGGGYVFGLPEQVDELMYRLSEDLKATIISVDYRLAPQFKFPIPILDGYDALIWLINNGEKELQVSTNNISVFGASAGAHLAAAITQMAVDDEKQFVKHQFLLYPVINNKLNTPSMEEFTDSPLWSKTCAEISWLHFLGDENMNKSLEYADLTNYGNFKNLPKTTIVACELDPLRDEGIEYAQRLYQAGVETELWVIPGALHIFDLLPSGLTDNFYNFLVKRLIQE